MKTSSFKLSIVRTLLVRYLLLLLRSSSLALAVEPASASADAVRSLSRLGDELYLRQQKLVEANPGSLYALARALKMAGVECRRQLSDEPWDCPIGANESFSIRPNEMFGKLMTRSFKETSFIRSLMSAAIAHSVTRACTENLLTTCSRKISRDGGYKEDVEFGINFAREFMEATHDPPLTPQQVGSSSKIVTVTGAHPLELGAGGGENANNNDNMSNHISTNMIQNFETTDPPPRRNIRTMINVHNDNVGLLMVLNGMRRECKCHGLSGACNMQTCWLRLPPFREVATKLRESLFMAVRVAYKPLMKHYQQQEYQKSSSSARKSNKKRSSVQQRQKAARKSARSVASRQEVTYDCEDCHRTSTVASGAQDPRSAPPTPTPSPSPTPSPTPAPSPSASPAPSSSPSPSPTYTPAPKLARLSGNSSSVAKRQPVARSIGSKPYVSEPSAMELVFGEDSPDFCEPNQRYQIKGTKGRQCSEDKSANNSCQKLCCGRGYKTEVREHKFVCECQFKYCCQLECKSCSQRKVRHICL